MKFMLLKYFDGHLNFTKSNDSQGVLESISTLAHMIFCTMFLYAAVCTVYCSSITVHTCCYFFTMHISGIGTVVTIMAMAATPFRHTLLMIVNITMPLILN